MTRVDKNYEKKFHFYFEKGWIFFLEIWRIFGIFEENENCMKKWEMLGRFASALGNRQTWLEEKWETD